MWWGVRLRKEGVISDTGNLVINATGLLPDADDTYALGASGTAFSDLFLASGAVINFAAGDITLTHAAETLTLAGGNYTFTQTVATSGSPTGFTFTGGANTGLTANTENTGFLIDFSATKQWLESLGFNLQREVVIKSPTYSAAEASDIAYAATFAVENGPEPGTNMGIAFAFGGLFGFDSSFVNWTSSASSAYSLGAGYSGINTGVGNVEDRAAFLVGSNGNVSLGDQTASLTKLIGIRIEAPTFVSTTNTRTVTGTVASLYIQGAPTVGSRSEERRVGKECRSRWSPYH